MTEETRSDGEVSTTLRGASVAVDTRLAARAAVLLCVVGLLVAGVVLLLSGVHKNAQIDALHDNGVATQATVTVCQGQLAGSGSNAGGFTCQGAYRVGGGRYRNTLPVSALLAPGTRVRLVADRADPLLIATPAALSAERASARVFVVPVVLLAAAVAIVGLVLWRRRGRSRRESAGVQPEGRSSSDLGDDGRLGAVGGV